MVSRPSVCTTRCMPSPCSRWPLPWCYSPHRGPWKRTCGNSLLRHCEFERRRAWPRGIGSCKARKSAGPCSSLSLQAVHGGTLKLTVLEGELRVATIGRLAAYALEGPENRVSSNARRQRRRSDFDRLEQSSGRVRRFKVLFFRTLNLLTLPDYHYPVKITAPTPSVAMFR